ncbi:hypothetical protein [Altericroceibacterium endophyticum]|uniref:Uncharacterized protein n=1 Tax=Altericroceibacterium endophyticum TaxID=1808508 RepID=A0A6I4T3M1_9SPHN|nr:hypothetical protein [Altericroceibacterium endophyticum]MXO64879.1 hypothetical protein [Altericroceibacterium endophyticum]
MSESDPELEHLRALCARAERWAARIEWAVFAAAIALAFVCTPIIAKNIALGFCAEWILP